MVRPGILIVEDDWIVAHGLREMLHADGFRVVGIASRRDRLEALLREAPALALVDIDLGRDGDGVELARDLLGPAGVTVVFTSAHADEDTLARARTAQPAGFVVKPFTRKQLRAAVEMALAGAERPRGAETVSVASHLASAHRALAQLAVAVGASSPGSTASLGALVAPVAEVRVRLQAAPELGSLSEREREVLLGLLEHRRVPAIAAHLGISTHTVRNHLKSIFAKLRVRSQQALLDLVIDRGRPTSASVAGADETSARASAQHRSPG